MPDTYSFCRFREFMVSGGEDGIAYFYDHQHQMVKTLTIDSQRGIQAMASTDDEMAFICFGTVRVFRFDNDMNLVPLWHSDKGYLGRSIAFTADSTLVVGTAVGVDIYDRDYSLDHHIPLGLMVMTIDIAADLCAAGLENGVVYVISVSLKQPLLILKGSKESTDKYESQPQCRWVKYHQTKLLVAIDHGLAGRILTYDTTGASWSTAFECDLWIMGGVVVTGNDTYLPRGSIVVALLQAVVIIDENYCWQYTWRRRHVVAVTVMGERVMSAAMGEDVICVHDVHSNDSGGRQTKRLRVIASPEDGV